MQQQKQKTHPRLHGDAVASALAAVVLATFLSCATRPTFEPIVLDLSAAKTATPEAPAPTATPIPVPPPPPTVAPKPAAAPASVPAVDLTPPPREKPEPPAPSAESPAGVVERHRQALDRGDVEAALAMYSLAARIETDAGKSATGRDAIRAFLNDQVRTSRPAESRERVASGTWVVERSSTGLIAYEVQDGRIVLVRILR